MSIVRFLYHPPLSKKSADMIAMVLPGAVARAWSCKSADGSLVAEDVEMEVYGMLEGHRSRYHFRIEVDVEDHPERRINLYERHERMEKEINDWLDRPFVRCEMPATKIHGRILVRLLPTSFSELSISPPFAL